MPRAPLLLAAAFCAATLSASDARAADPWRGLDPEGHAQTCKHFTNRARFLPRGPEADWLALAADACAEALARVSAPDAADHAGAQTLLTRLTALRLTVREMNTTRIYGADAGPTALPVASSRGAWSASGGSARPVSRTGEYLIARRMGAIAALRGWADGSR